MMTVTTFAGEKRRSSTGFDLAGADAEALRMLAELRSLSAMMGEMSEKAYRQLAARPTVTRHLSLARDHLAELGRNLTRAEAMLAFNARACA